MHWYFLIYSYYLTVSNELSLTALQYEEFTLIFGSLKPGRGVNLKIYPKSENELLFLYALVFPYICLLFDCFEWALIDCIAKRRVHSELGKCQTRGGGEILKCTLNLKMSFYFYMHWYFLIYSYYLTVANGCSLTAL